MDLFKKTVVDNSELDALKDKKKFLEQKILELELEHKLALKEKEFELKHFKDDEVQDLRTQVSKKDQEIAVLKKENEMLDKIVDLNADIVDVKELVKTLIAKLPNIDIKSINLSSNSKE